MTTTECLKCRRSLQAKTETEECQYLNLKKKFNEHGNSCPFFTESATKTRNNLWEDVTDFYTTIQ